MNHTSLSSFVRSQAETAGVIPQETKDRIRVIQGAENAFDRSLSPADRAERSLVWAFDELRMDTAKLEAARELAVENRVDTRHDTFIRGVKVDKAPLLAMQAKFDALLVERRAVCIDDLTNLIAQAEAMRAALEAEQNPPSEPAAA